MNCVLLRHAVGCGVFNRRRTSLVSGERKSKNELCFMFRVLIKRFLKTIGTGEICQRVFFSVSVCLFAFCTTWGEDKPQKQLMVSEHNRFLGVTEQQHCDLHKPEDEQREERLTFCAVSQVNLLDIFFRDS